MNQKRIRQSMAAALAVLALAVGAVAVYAFLHDRIEEKNQFHIGEDLVEVKETFTEPVTLQMENTFMKEVAVKNTGTSEEYVRVFLDFSDSSVRDKSTIIYTKGGNTKEASWSSFLADLPEGWVYIPEDASGDDAVLGGYFYYTKILAPETPWAPETAAHHDTPPSSGTGEPNEHFTTPLILGLKTDFGDGINPDQITNFDVIVYSESVQTVEIGAGASSGQVYDSATDTEAWKKAWKSFLSLT